MGYQNPQPDPQFTQGQVRDSDRLLSDGSLVKHNNDHSIQFTANKDEFKEHITVFHDDPQSAHWSAYGDDGKMFQEPLDF